MKKIITTLTVTIALVLGMMTGFTANVNAAEDNGCIPMLRLYNPNSGEHFYTGSKEEKKALVLAGWNYEGIAWHAPKTGDPVYRLYNENAGDHHYTLSAKERDNLVDLGWKYEGVAWYSDPNGTPLYRLYNPNAVSGSHHYTMSEKERDSLVDAGWTFEGEGWKANSACTCTEEPAEQPTQQTTDNNTQGGGQVQYGEDIQSINTIVCGHCGATFETDEECIAHLYAEHVDDDPEPSHIGCAHPNAWEDENGMLYCPDCGGYVSHY